MPERNEAREWMVNQQIAGRGLTDPRVLAAMREVPREAFVPEALAEFAYEDSALPIAEGQTISQPYIVALMAALAAIGPEDRVLEVGTGSGYAAAVLSRMAAAVYTVERHGALADAARDRLRRLGYDNIYILQGDGSRGWPEHAPFDAIIVAAGGPEVPIALRNQLAIGGRLVVPVGQVRHRQRLRVVRRTGEDEFESEDFGDVAFVPLIGEGGWQEHDDAPESDAGRRRLRPPVDRPGRVPEMIRDAAEPLVGAEDSFDALLDRVGDARIVLLGEATHGTAEFYRARARITERLVRERGFAIVAVEADWPDAARIDDYVRHRDAPTLREKAFVRFPTWMWRNVEVHDFIERLRRHNAGIDDPARRAGFYGLDLYSLNASIGAVLGYLDKVDPEAARIARARYGCLSPWEKDPATYGRAALSGGFRTCEREVTSMLRDLLDRRFDYFRHDGEAFLDAAQNARLVASAERYYRVMYYGGREAWNLRDRHMFETLQALLDARGPDSKAVAWAHNSHVGNAAATEMGRAGEFNIGQLCREAYGSAALLVGFGTDRGTVAAASDWDGPMETKTVRPSRAGSYERLCHEAGIPAFLLGLRREDALRDALDEPRFERAIGVIYRPETEFASHYFEASLPRQFDEYIWFDETHAVVPLPAAGMRGLPDTYPFGV